MAVEIEILEREVVRAGPEPDIAEQSRPLTGQALHRHTGDAGAEISHIGAAEQAARLPAER